MKKAIDLIVKVEMLMHKENLLYELLGKYGDKLPKDIQEDMREYADMLKTFKDRLKKKLVKETKI